MHLFYAVCIHLTVALILLLSQNKAERKLTREQALLKKNPVAIKEELDKLEAMGTCSPPAAADVTPVLR